MRIRDILLLAVSVATMSTCVFVWACWIKERLS